VSVEASPPHSSRWTAHIEHLATLMHLGELDALRARNRQSLDEARRRRAHLLAELETAKAAAMINDELR
jgi:RNA:NAD 2'-phosphotransferase (TPT1/KptA family)